MIIIQKTIGPESEEINMVNTEIEIFIDKHADDSMTRFEVQYYDDPECWTVPVLLTTKRAEYLKNDPSISRIRFTIQSAMNKGFSSRK